MISALLLTALIAVTDTRTAETDPIAKNVLIELFTSQGCSSCPPAEKFLADIKESGLPTGRILPLAFHVDYWDRLGWKDPFSAAAFTTRQQLYARAMRLSSVYTPQMVVDGAFEMNGSNRPRVLEAVRRRLAQPAEFKISLIVDTSAGGKARVRAAVTAPFYMARHESPPPGAPKLIFAATFLPESTTRVLDGENAGISIRQVNIVRTLSDPAPFRPGKLPATAEFNLPFSSEEKIAVWVQDYKTLAVDHAEIWRGH